MLKPKNKKTRPSYRCSFSGIVSGFKSFAKKIANPVLISDSKKLVFFTYFATVVLVGMVASVFVIIFVFAFFSGQLPDPNKLLERSSELSTRFYDKNGKLIYELYGEKNRTLINLDQVSENTIHATLATEDADFYLHKGYSLRGMARAVKNMLFGGNLQSGSTLTQQVIKNTLLSQEQTLQRKIKEFILSLQLENKYPKEKILQMYLNETPYGGQNYGIYSASKAYFNKDPKDLSVAESAYLAGLPQRPSYYSQYGPDPEAGIKRKNDVLYLMNVRGWIGPEGKRYYLSDEEYESALNEELKFDVAKVPFAAPHFVFYVRQLLSDMLSEETVEQGGLSITTSLDLDVQDIAQKIVTEEVEKAADMNVYNGAMVVLDPKTGGILAMVGSKGYNLPSLPEGCVSGGNEDTGCLFDPFVNVSTSKRQPGSAIKPITYATMLSQGYTLSFPFLDVPTKFEGSAPDKPYTPENYDGKFRGIVSMRKSLGNSLNIPAVKALKIAGITNMIDTAEKMGISTFTDRSRYGLALTLGGGETRLLELTGAYSVFSAQGAYRRPNSIMEVKDSRGVTLYKWQDTGGQQALDKGVAFLISDVLADDGARSSVFGAGSLLNIPGQVVSVKTGTTDEKRDNYAIGFTPSVVAGVWVGNSNNVKMNPNIASGITGATPIWRRFMIEYLKDKPSEKPVPPENVKKIEVDSLTGMLPNNDDDKRNEWFLSGTEPTAKSDWFERLEICEIDGRIANEECKDADKTEVKTFIKVKAELPQWQSAVDTWVKENYDDDKYFPPQMVSRLDFDGDSVDNKDEVFVEITYPPSGVAMPLDFRLSVEVSSYKDVKNVTFYLDGEKISEDDSEPYGYGFKIPADKIGEHEFEVTARDKEGNKGSTSRKINIVGYAVD